MDVSSHCSVSALPTSFVLNMDLVDILGFDVRSTAKTDYLFTDCLLTDSRSDKDFLFYPNMETVFILVCCMLPDNFYLQH